MILAQTISTGMSHSASEHNSLRLRADPVHIPRWISGPKDRIEVFIKTNNDHFAEDHDRDPVCMPRLLWHIDRVERDYSDLKLTVTSEMMV